MIPRNVLNKVAIVAAIVIIAAVFVSIRVNFPLPEEHILFPGIIGDTVLKSNETGIYYTTNITLYDDFRGNVIQGHKATYSGTNGTVIIFIAQMPDNESAYMSFKDMVIRAGYNESMSFDDSIKNYEPVIKLPVENPEVFVIQKDKNAIWHYTYNKLDKVYWIGFGNPDTEYQALMLIEIYRNVDSKKVFSTID